jgi:uncharacterized membrane protein
MVCVCQPSERAELREREEEVLRSIVEMGGVARFYRLRKKTKYHQEVLSRVLKRLVRYGYLVRNGEGGYRVCCVDILE